VDVIGPAAVNCKRLCCKKRCSTHNTSKGVATDLAGIIRAAGLEGTLINPEYLDVACP